jgi:leucyl aminopeptidase
MEEQFSFHKIPSVHASDKALFNYHISVITNLDSFKASQGEFKASKLKTNSSQIDFHGEKATHYFLKELKEATLTQEQIEEIALAVIPAVQSSKIASFDISFDINLTAVQLG